MREPEEVGKTIVFARRAHHRLPCLFRFNALATFLTLVKQGRGANPSANKRHVEW
jgi:hypothetical protein